MVIPSNIDELSFGSTVVGIADDVVRYESLACSVRRFVFSCRGVLVTLP